MTDIAVTFSTNAEGALLTLEPGQTYVLRADRRLTPEHADRIRDILAAKVPGVEFLILGADVDLVRVDA